MTSVRMEPFLGFSRMLEAYKGLRTTSAGTCLAVQGQALCSQCRGLGSILRPEIGPMLQLRVHGATKKDLPMCTAAILVAKK